MRKMRRRFVPMMNMIAVAMAIASTPPPLTTDHEPGSPAS